MARRDSEFLTIRSEGGLLPADLLRRILDPAGKLDGTRPQDYGLPEGERLSEVITQSWNRLRKHWAEFRAALADLAEGEAGTGLTNEKWSLPLLRELGFGLLPTTSGPELNGRTYAISRFFGPVPIHLVGAGLSLDRKAAGQRGAATTNPHGLVQEFLNRSTDHLWAIVGNGLRLRVLRDNQALSRQSFLEFDLAAMFGGEVYSDFVLLWLAAHATRFTPREAARPDSCWLEEWTREAEKQGTRALGDLRGGVERALQILGEGFTGHPKNVNLRDALRSGALPLADFHGQLLRVVYRLIFLFVAEDRVLDGQPLLHPRDESDSGKMARQRFSEHYGTARLRHLAGTIKGSRHSDLWRQFQLLVGALSGESAFKAVRDQLALPSLGSFLWSPDSTAALNGSELANYDLLEALRYLAYTRQGRALRPVDYRNLGAEELGGVYESLLALTPQISADGARFTFAEFAGNERKTSGSYYTPDALVQCLLDSALDPVVTEAIRGKSALEAEKAILSLKVCDPAVGSGHFLVGAAHRLARHLARVRSQAQGESEPSPPDYQHALRDVIGRCLYGVDINPMAAELCRVSLWLEALEPGKPLSFLDHHVRVGNSLIGAAPDVLVGGIPDEAFTPIEGDDKKACTILKKRNKAERSGVGPLFAQQDAESLLQLQHAAAALEELPDDRPEDVRAKELAFRRHEATQEFTRKKLVANAWCAAFVGRKCFKEPGRDSSVFGLTQQHLNDLASGRSLPHDLATEAERLSGQYQFFHWWLALPEVFAKGGFDCVLSNPPWEHTELAEKEWFAERNPAIASARNGAERKRMIEALRTTDPALYSAFSDALRHHDGVGHTLAHSGRFPQCGRGRINLYAVFAEAMRALLSPSGLMGCVLPTGIVTDDTTKVFFQDLVTSASLVSVFDFENKLLLFPAVAPVVKFCLLTVGSGALPLADSATFLFFAHRLTDLAKEHRRLKLSASDIALINPNTRTCPIFRTRDDALLTRALYRRVPVLIRETDSGKSLTNPWGVFYKQGMFNMTTHSHLFNTREQLERAGWQLDGNVFRLGTRVALPLYEGKLFQQYNHRPGTFDGVAEASRFQVKAAIRRYGPEDLADPTVVTVPRYWVAQEDVEASLGGPVPWVLAFRDVTNVMTNSRNAVFAALPFYALAAPLLLLKDAAAVACFYSCANSFVFDYVTRQKLAGGHLTYFILKQLPMLEPEVATVAAPWAPGQSVVEWVAPRVLELTYTAWDMEPFARDCRWLGPPFRWDEERRFLLRCELDAAYFALYMAPDSRGEWQVTEGESEAELAQLRGSFPRPRDAVLHVMNTFPIVQRKEEEAYGEYRSRRVVMEIYDALQEAVRTGRPYQSGVQPPPADPRCCHPARRPE